MAKGGPRGHTDLGLVPAALPSLWAPSWESPKVGGTVHLHMGFVIFCRWRGRYFMLGA